MSPSLFFPAVLLGLSLFSWRAFPRRIAEDVAEWEITQEQGRRYVFFYRGWSVAFAVAGVTLIILSLAGK